MACALLFDRVRELLVRDQARHPDESRYEASDEQQTPCFGCEHDSDECRDDQVAVATVEHDVVVELGGAQHSIVAIAVRVVVLADRDNHSHSDGCCQHQDVKPRRVVEAILGRQLLCEYEQSSNHASQEEISGEERCELVVPAQRHQSAFTDQADEDEQPRSQQPAEQQRDPEVVVHYPVEAGQQADLVRSIHCESPHFMTRATRRPNELERCVLLYYSSLTCLCQYITSGTIGSTMVKPKTTNNAILNRRARFDYELGAELVVGLELTGAEVRAARDGHVQLKGSYVALRNDELWLQNASFSLKLNQKGAPGARTIDTEPKRLLAKRKEIEQLASQKKQGMSIVPIKLLSKGRFIKLVISLGKGKKNYDKRETLKRRDQDREANRQLKH